MQKNYLYAGGIILAVLAIVIGVTAYMRGGEDSWVVILPQHGHVAKDEFIPVDIRVRLERGERAEDLPGTFWIVIPTEEKTHLLPFVPREVTVWGNTHAQVDPIVFGTNGLKYGESHHVTGYAYLSPLIFDGTYQAYLAYGHYSGDARETPLEYSRSSSFSLSVTRTFQTRKSVLATPLIPHVAVVGPTERSLLRFSLESLEDGIQIRAFELGEPHSHRLPEAVVSVALYNASTGELLSELTDLKTNALTIEQFTPYVLDTPLTLMKGSSVELEIRAKVDPAKIRVSPADNVLSMPRLYALNASEEKIAEQVFLKGEVMK